MIDLKLRDKARSVDTVVVCAPCPQWFFSKKELDAVCKGKKVLTIPYLCSGVKPIGDKLKGVKSAGVLACGAGAQVVAELVNDVVPLCDSRETFVRNPDLRHYCFGCGDCSIEETMGVCVFRCPKNMRNGPCGGVRDGKCEVPGVGACVWIDIFKKMSENGFVLNRAAQFERKNVPVAKR